MGDAIETNEQLENQLSEPSSAAVELFKRVAGDVILLGVAGKMGPSLARMTKRAADESGRKRRIIGVARFSSASVETELRQHGIETIRCDLLDEDSVARLPDAPNVLYLAGMKFGAEAQASLTWAMNTQVPATICKKYARSRIVALSTGNVYGLVPATGGGSVETDAPAPVGEYAMSCLGRERIFEHFSRAHGTPVALIRLNYACELRYGVLVDLAQKILADAPIDLSMGWFNLIWQGDANNIALRCLEKTTAPPTVINLTGPELLNVRETCEALGVLLDRKPIFTGTESPTALLNNAQRTLKQFGVPRVGAGQLAAWIAAWLRNGGPTLNKPTHFENRDGRY